MLKIITTRNDKNHLVVSLTGQLTVEYIAELERVFDADAATKIVLDMSNVMFVDRKSMEFLCGMRSKIRIENIPAWVMRWIEVEFRCGGSQRKS